MRLSVGISGCCKLASLWGCLYKNPNGLLPACGPFCPATFTPLWGLANGVSWCSAGKLRSVKLLPLLAALCFGLATAQSTAPGVLTLRFLDVGQGNSVLITAPEGQTLLYDGGRSEARMRELIRQYGVGQVDVVVASHADSDHITGLIPAVALFKPRFFVNNGLAGDTQTWTRLVHVAELAGTKGMVAQEQVINLGSVKVTILPPPPGMPTEQNLNSVGLLVQYGMFKALMTGDSEHAETQGRFSLSMWWSVWGRITTAIRRHRR